MKDTAVVVVNGRRYEYLLRGTGAPNVVLINGSGGPILGWHKIIERLAEHATVFAYNRDGIGKSSKADQPQTAQYAVEVLRTLLLACRLAPPYLLVGHSFGGLIANLFARTYPAEVCGAVFLDATAPDDIALSKATENRVQSIIRWALDRLLGQDMSSEAEHALESAEQIAKAPAFPAVPLAVITGGTPALKWLTPTAFLVARAEHQRRLASLSEAGRQIVAARSGHFPQFTQPELVCEAVLDTWERTKH